MTSLQNVPLWEWPPYTHRNHTILTLNTHFAKSTLNASTTSLSATISGGVGTSNVISTLTGKDNEQTKRGPCGVVMWILYCLGGGSMTIPNTMFALSRSTRLEGGVPSG